MRFSFLKLNVKMEASKNMQKIPNECRCSTDTNIHRFSKQHLKPSSPPSPHPPFVSLLRNNLEQFLNFTLQENQMAGRWARLPKHRRSRPNFWPSLSDRPHQMFVLAGRAPNLCHSQNTERAFHFARASALEDWEPKLTVPQPGWSLCCVVGKQGCN